MPRSIWTGTISFGLVTIPVTLHPAVRDRGPHFHLLHAKDRSRIKNQRVCEREGKAVEWKDVVRGFEYRKGHYVVVTDEDFERAALERSKTVDVLAFVDRDEIDERFFETSYFLVPEKSGERAYALLREAIRKTRRLGIGKFVLREAQHLVALHVVGDAIVLTVMHFSEDLVPISGHDFPATSGLRAKDVELAESLIERLSERWRPEKYVDEYRGNL